MYYNSPGHDVGHRSSRSLLYSSGQLLICVAVCLPGLWRLIVGSKLSITVRPSQVLTDLEHAPLARLLLVVSPLLSTPASHSLALIYRNSQNPATWTNPQRRHGLLTVCSDSRVSGSQSHPPTSRLMWPLSSLMMPSAYLILKFLPVNQGPTLPFTALAPSCRNLSTKSSQRSQPLYTGRL
jgi:hypothetical protein